MWVDSPVLSLLSWSIPLYGHSQQSYTDSYGPKVIFTFSSHTKSIHSDHDQSLDHDQVQDQDQLTITLFVPFVPRPDQFSIVIIKGVLKPCTIFLLHSQISFFSTGVSIFAEKFDSVRDLIGAYISIDISKTFRVCLFQGNKNFLRGRTVDKLVRNTNQDNFDFQLFLLPRRSC